VIRAEQDGRNSTLAAFFGRHSHAHADSRFLLRPRGSGRGTPQSNNAFIAACSKGYSWRLIAIFSGFGHCF